MVDRGWLLDNVAGAAGILLMITEKVHNIDDFRKQMAESSRLIKSYWMQVRLRTSMFL